MQPEQYNSVLEYNYNTVIRSSDGPVSLHWEHVMSTTPCSQESGLIWLGITCYIIWDMAKQLSRSADAIHYFSTSALCPLITCQLTQVHWLLQMFWQSLFHHVMFTLRKDVSDHLCSWNICYFYIHRNTWCSTSSTKNNLSSRQYKRDTTSQRITHVGVIRVVKI